MTGLGSRAMLRLAPLALLLVAVAIVSGCEVNTEGDNLVNGKKLFIGQGRCGSCHALARAGTKGTAGPDLDQAFQRSLNDGFKRSTIRGIVHKQILYPNKNPQVDPETEKEVTSMPAELVTGQDAFDVAAYVAEVAAKPGKDTGLLATVGGGGPKGTAVEKAGVLAIPADPTGQLFYVFKDATANAGQVKIESQNKSAVDHDISIEGNGVNENGDVVKNGGTSEVDVDLKPGDYTFFCSVPGHREAGMEGKLTVK
jgi:plastocyanin/mono/diheme cytochrome c family protein